MNTIKRKASVTTAAFAAAALLIMGAEHAFAQNYNNYTITGSGTSFTVTRDDTGDVLVSGVSIQAAIDAILDTGMAGEITLGSGGSTLNIGTASIIFDGRGAFLFGNVTSANPNSTIETRNGAPLATHSMSISNTGSGRAITGSVRIHGGTVSSATGVAIDSNGGWVRALLSTVTSANTTTGTIYNSGNGKLEITDGTISNTGGAPAINSVQGLGSVLLCRTPTITGTIVSRAGGLSVEASDPYDMFAPGNNVYAVEITTTPIVPGSTVAVVNGETFLQNFTVVNAGYRAGIRGGDVVLAGNDYNYTIAFNYNPGWSYIVRRDLGGAVVGPASVGIISNAIDIIRADAGGNACGITFGANNAELHASTDTITFDGAGSPSWGHITLRGTIMSLAHYEAVRFENGVSATVASARITNESTIGGHTLRCNASGAVEFTDCTIVAQSGYALYNNGAGPVTLRGSVFSSERTDGTIYSQSGDLNILGGQVENSGVGFSIVHLNNGNIRLGNSPTFRNAISAPASRIIVNTSGPDAFNPGNNVCAVNITGTIVDGTSVAVVGGANFMGNFTSANAGYRLLPGGANLILTTHGYDYTITSSGTAFTATRDYDGVLVGTANVAIQTAVNAIRHDAAGKDCAITFGAGSTLDLGTAGIDFNNSASPSWGQITLHGAVTSARASNYTIHAQDGVSVASDADITNTGASGQAVSCSSAATLSIHGGAVSATGSSGVGISNSGGTVHIHDGTVSGGHGINNGSGTVNIHGGTVSAASANGAGISNPGGTVNILGGTVSATGSAGHGINNSATVNIQGGEVSATGNAAVFNGSSGMVTVRGAATVTSASATSGAVYNDGNGVLDILGGTIHNTDGGPAVVNANTGSGTVKLGNAPNVVGAIEAREGGISVHTSGADAFNPGSKNYAVRITTAPVVPGATVAVVGGAGFIGNFISATAGHILTASASDLVLSPHDYHYTITGGDGNFTAWHDMDNTPVGAANVAIQTAIDFIKADAAGHACTIYVIASTSGVIRPLDIGEEALTFDGGTGSKDWGLITLGGLVTSAGANTVTIQNGVSVTSNASIANTTRSGGATVYFDSGGTLNITGGSVSRAAAAGSAVHNAEAGTVTLRDAVTVSGGGLSNPVILNASTGTINLFGGTVQNNSTGPAVANTGSGRINLGNAPVLYGVIASPESQVSVITGGVDAFNPGHTRYRVEITSTHIVSGVTVAVLDGANFLSNFTPANAGYTLTVSGANLVLTEIPSGDGDPAITAIRIVNGTSGEPEKQIEIEAEGCTNDQKQYALFGHHEEISTRFDNGVTSLNAEIVSAGRKPGVNDGIGRILFTFPKPNHDRFFFHIRQIE
ncbi:MAG: hypothetical protein FWG50_10000 [Kiritimatiellaeota bacterium]|nr:hypothetical protein [Kiritimatiellota bacterium]